MTITPVPPPPYYLTPEDVSGYTGVPYDWRAYAAIQAEKAAQAKVCKIDPYTNDLQEALLRRVVRNLAMRNVPLGVQMDETGGTIIGSRDPEIRRLEGPYRKLPVG